MLMVSADSPRPALKWVSSRVLYLLLTCKGTPPTKAESLVPPSFLTSYPIVPPKAPLGVVVGWS